MIVLQMRPLGTLGLMVVHQWDGLAWAVETAEAIHLFDTQAEAQSWADHHALQPT